MPKHEILLLAPDFRCQGGVADFSRMLVQNLSCDFHVDHMIVGSQFGRASLAKRLFCFISALCRLIAKIRTGHYQIIHVNPSFRIYSLLRDSFYIRVAHALGYRGKTVVFFHGWDLNLAERILYRPLWSRIFVGIYKHAGVVFVLHKLCKEQLVNMGIKPQKIRVTTTMYQQPVNESKGHPSVKPDKKVIMLFLSRIVQGKGADIVIKVAKLLVENGYYDFHLFLAGDGPLLPDLKKSVAENGMDEYVGMLGYVRGREKTEILEKSDIFFLPTWLDEGCPVAIMEAMGAGLAIISTPRGAIPEIIEDGREGFICDSRAPSAFFEVIRRLLDDRNLLNEMQKAAKAKAEENYEASVYIRKMEAMYSSIIRSHR